MSDENSLDYIVSKLAYGLKMADEERREPAVATEFVSLQDLAEKVGQEALKRLIWLMESRPRKADEFPLIVLQAGGRILNVAVINPKDVLDLVESGIMPSFKDLAEFSAGLAQYIVLTKQNALFVFSQEELEKTGEEVLQSAIRLGAYLRPQSVEFVDKRRCILTWYEEN
jgi:hypothetical protein